MALTSYQVWKRLTLRMYLTIALRFTCSQNTAFLLVGVNVTASRELIPDSSLRFLDLDFGVSVWSLFTSPLHRSVKADELSSGCAWINGRRLRVNVSFFSTQHKISVVNNVFYFLFLKQLKALKTDI